MLDSTSVRVVLIVFGFLFRGM